MIKNIPLNGLRVDFDIAILCKLNLPKIGGSSESSDQSCFFTSLHLFISVNKIT